MKRYLTLLAALVIVAGVHAQTKGQKPGPKPTTQAAGHKDEVKTPPAPPAPPLEAKEPKEKEKEKHSLELGSVNAFGQTEERARTVAQLKARDKVLAFLAKQQPPIKFEPSLEFLQTGHFVKDEVTTVEVSRDADGKEVGGAQHECTVKVELSPALFGEILKQEHQSIQSDRQWLAGKVLAVLLALVLALGGYFYLDELTKGFYTVMLRIGAVGLVGAVCVAVWLVMH